MKISKDECEKPFFVLVLAFGEATGSQPSVGMEPVVGLCIVPIKKGQILH